MPDLKLMSRPASRLLAVFACLGFLHGCTSGSDGSSTEALQLASSPSSPAATAAGGLGLRSVAELPPPDTQNGGEQPISANDVLEVEVFEVKNLNRTVQVDTSGFVSLPLIGNVQAGGKTVRQLESEIERSYGAKYLQNPDVTVYVKESVGQRVTIDGEVSKAGIYPVSSNSTLLDAVALAGGFRSVADPAKVFIYRNYSGTKLVANYDVGAIRAGKRPNPRIYGGDVIVVFKSSSRVALQNLKEALGVVSSASRLAL